jgi:hypothetical protein
MWLKFVQKDHPSCIVQIAVLSGYITTWNKQAETRRFERRPLLETSSFCLFISGSNTHYFTTHTGTDSYGIVQTTNCYNTLLNDRRCCYLLWFPEEVLNQQWDCKSVLNQQCDCKEYDSFGCHENKISCNNCPFKWWLNIVRLTWNIKPWVSIT